MKKINSAPAAKRRRIPVLSADEIAKMKEMARSLGMTQSEWFRAVVCKDVAEARARVL
jgi:hypothetical protein